MKGVARALGAVVLAATLLGGMLWLLGNPSLVLMWRAEYLIGGFVALLAAAAIVTAWRGRGASKAQRPSSSGLVLPWVRGIGVALGALLLVLALYLLAFY